MSRPSSSPTIDLVKVTVGIGWPASVQLAWFCMRVPVTEASLASITSDALMVQANVPPEVLLVRAQVPTMLGLAPAPQAARRRVRAESQADEGLTSIPHHGYRAGVRVLPLLLRGPHPPP